MKRLLLALLLLASVQSVQSVQLIMASGFEYVPSNHRVLYIKGIVVAHVNLTSSGVLLVDYGQSGSWQHTNSLFEAALVAGSASAVVILQNEMIDKLKQANELDQFFAYWNAAKERGVSAVWVLPLRASEQAPVVNAIRGAGYEVHASTWDGACFVEVHKPDGSITAGMPGPAL